MAECHYCRDGAPLTGGVHLFKFPKWDLRLLCLKGEDCNHSVPSGKRCIRCGKEWSGVADESGAMTWADPHR